MARRKKSFFRRSAARVGRYVRRGTKSSRAQLLQVDAMAYGAVRQHVSNWIQSVVPIPVIGSLGDEVAMGLVNYLVAKNTSGLIKDVATKGLVIENARVGEQLASGMFGSSGSGSSGAVLLG